MSIGVVLNTYKRRNTGLQLEAIRGQTVQPDDILVWRNDSWTDDEFRELAGDVRFIKASQNMGVWPRFLAGCLILSQFIAVFDDDTVPGSRWLENCLHCFNRQPGVYGSKGIRLPPDVYRGGKTYGWSKSSASIEQVDVVGHAWFFPRWLCGKAVNLFNGHLQAGEDMALSFIAQTNGFDTFTPPHPCDDRELWGSLDGLRLGRDGTGVSSTRVGWHGYEAEYRRLRGLGWRLMSDG